MAKDLLFRQGFEAGEYPWEMTSRVIEQTQKDWTDAKNGNSRAIQHLGDDLAAMETLQQWTAILKHLGNSIIPAEAKEFDNLPSSFHEASVWFAKHH